MDHSENTPVNPRIESGAETIGDIIERRLSRRGFLGGMAAVSGLALTACAGRPPETAAAGQMARPKAAFGFPEIARGMDQTHRIAEGYRADILLRWGDPLWTDSPAFDPLNQSAAAQQRQFGFNCDYVGFVPLDPDADGATRGLICVNHEYTSTNLMFPGVTATYPASVTREITLTEIAAHGGTIAEIRRTPEGWRTVIGSPYNRRLTADTPMKITGPAAGHPRLYTSDDPVGRNVLGTLNNCAGGITPWGTYLMAEENINGNFLGALTEGHPEAANHGRMGVPGGWYQWGRHLDRFDVSKEPNEPNRFGWIVEVDPKDPASTPKKRTALGRFKHEGAESVVAPDGRVVIYSGDDQRFDYVYKFVTRGRFIPGDRAANMDLLDEGTLYCARFNDDGTLVWLPLVFGAGPLTSANGFHSQADVVIEARRAGDLLGATPMDRPEDVEPDPRSGRVYVMLTNNDRRTPEQVDTANPRPGNRFGHIIEITEPGGDFASETSAWEILVRCGDPSVAEVGATWNPLTSENGWLASPDNCALDARGRLWVSTDGNGETGAADGLWAIETEGQRRGTGRHFFRCPIGAELCGPVFTPDGETLFLAVQHPGDGESASYEVPTTRWPDFTEALPPRPSVVVVTRMDGGVIGG
jgi:secreted PhoX family phosphatase